MVRDAAAMALAVAGQADFGAGIYRGREAPDNAAYDLLNCLIDDEGQPFRRGGSAYKSNGNAATTLLGLTEMHTFGGRRTAFWTATKLYVLDADDATLFEVVDASVTGIAPAALSRPAAIGGVYAFRSTTGGLLYYAGSRKARYSTGTASFTAGSKIMTGVGTAWLANVDKGMFLSVVAPDGTYVESVDSNTQITLSKPAASTVAGVGYQLRPIIDPGGITPTWTALGAVGTVPRLLQGSANRVYFTEPGDISSTAEYHELPGGAQVIGLDTLGGDALVFTTVGMWAIGNMDFDVIDDVGNVQHTVRQQNEIVLWGDAGLAKWRAALVAPAVDDVWLMGPGGAMEPIGGGIKPLYLSYVKAGYQPGTAAVHRGHYFLPIINGTTLVDVLVCRLDRGFAWTRWAGHGAGIAYTQRIGSTTRSPKLLSINGLRLTELTDAWTPTASNASEADATTHALLIDTRDYPTPAGRQGSTTKQLRVRYEATAAGAISITAKFSRGPEGSAYTSLTNLRGGAAADGLDESVWSVVRKTPAIRFRIESASALSSFTLREVVARYTQSGAL